MKSKIKSISSWKVFLIFLAVSFLTRLPGLKIPILDVDEAIWAAATRIWIDGGLPYLNFVDNKPLGIFLFFKLIFSTLGFLDLRVVHFVQILIVAGTALGIFKLTEFLSEKRAGLMAGFFYLVFSTTHTPEFISTSIESVLNLPLVFGVFYFVKSYSQPSQSRRNLIYAGILIGLACCFKFQTGIIGLGFALLLWIQCPPTTNSREPILNRITSSLLLAFGAMIPLAATCIYSIYLGIFWEMLDWSLMKGFFYIGAGGGRVIALKFFLPILFMLLSCPLWIFAVRESFLFLKSTFRKRTLEWNYFILIMWLIFSTVTILPGWRFFGHYFYYWLLPLSILAGLHLHRTWDGWMLTKLFGLSRRLWLYGVSAFLFVVCLTPRLFLDHTFTRDLFRLDDLKKQQSVGEWVQANSSLGESIFVWGFAPAIYYYSDRTPASRFIFYDYLCGRVSRPGLLSEEEKAPFISPLLWAQFQEDIQTKKPRYLVDTSPAGIHDAEFYPTSDYPILKKILQDDYRLVNQLEGVMIYERRTKD